MSRTKAWGQYHPILTGLIDKAKDPDTTIELHGITKLGGIADQYRYLEYLESGEVMENVQTAVKQGFDAFIIGNIADPGLRECREIANIPVLGLCETSMLLSCQMGANFALVTLNEKFTPRIVENAHRLAIERRLHSVERMKSDRILTLGEAFSSEPLKREFIDHFMQTAGRAVEAGAEVIIPAGGVLMALLAQEGIHEVGRGTPVLNGITALIKMGETAAKLNRLMGGNFTSKRLAYAPPGPDQIDEIRKYYGDIYPTVGSGG